MFKTAAPAIGLLLLLLPALSYWLYPPGVKHSTEVSAWVAKRLAQKGHLTRYGIVPVAVVLLALVLWVAGGTYIGAATVSIVAVSLLLITSVLTWNDIAGHKSAWTTFFWLGALIALSDGLNRVGCVKWFGDGIAPHMAAMSPLVAIYLFAFLVISVPWASLIWR